MPRSRLPKARFRQPDTCLSRGLRCRTPKSWCSISQWEVRDPSPDTATVILRTSASEHRRSFLIPASAPCGRTWPSTRSQFQLRRRTLSCGTCSTGSSSRISSSRHRNTSFLCLRRISKSQIRSSKAPSDKLREKNPELQGSAEQDSQRRAAVELAKREKKPDFGVQYMWQHTADNFRDYYMGTFSIKLPNRSRVRAAEGESQAKLAQ